MTHVPCGDGFVERACRNVVCYIDSMIGCYNNSCKQAKRKDMDMAALNDGCAGAAREASAALQAEER